MSLFPAQNPGPRSAPAARPLDVVRRGYDRDQVDAALRELRDRLSATETARQTAEQHAGATEAELRTARTTPAEAAPTESFGFRAEKILRLAEQEAADVRSRAAKEAAAVVEQARADAERHRHEVEQALISRSAELDHEAAQRNAVLQEREQQAAATLAAAREDAARIAEEARRTAEALVGEAQNRAEEGRNRSEQDGRRRRESAELDLRRITGVHESVRSEMGRLHTLLTSELDAPGDGKGAVRGARTS